LDCGYYNFIFPLSLVQQVQRNAQTLVVKLYLKLNWITV